MYVYLLLLLLSQLYCTVPVGNALALHVHETIHDLEEIVAGPALVEHPVVINESKEVTSTVVRGHQVEEALINHAVKERHNVWVEEIGRVVFPFMKMR